MNKYFAEIEFWDVNGNIYWFPFYIQADSESDANEFLLKHVTELKSRYDIHYANLTQVFEGFNSNRIAYYRKQAFSGKPVKMKIETWLVRGDEEILETNPAIDFGSNNSWLLNEHGQIQNVHISSREFPVQLIGRTPMPTGDEVILINIFKH